MKVTYRNRETKEYLLDNPKLLPKKTFLSDKEVVEVRLDSSVSEIEDWAFSHAENLEKIWIPEGCVSFGKKLFLGCKSLRNIYFFKENEDEVSETESRMLAYSVRFFKDETTLSQEIFKSEAWYRKWDADLIQFVRKDDLEGYVDLWASGEEDYEGKDYDIHSYPIERRLEKLRIIYFRLINPVKLEPEVENELKEYLRLHTKGTDKSEAWDILVKEYDRNLEAFKCLADAGGLNEENFLDAFDDAQKLNAQIKAFLLKWKEENLEKKESTEFDLGW